MRKEFALLLVILLVLPLILTGCKAGEENFIFGTYYRFELRGSKSGAAKREINAFLAALEKELSTSHAQSAVSKINHSQKDVSVPVPDSFITMFKESARFYEMTEVFNPALFPLVELWNFSPDTFTGAASYIPSAQSIAELLPLCSLDVFLLDENAKTVTKTQDGAKLDFGGIAKGYAVDRAYEIAKNRGANAVINIGGTIKTGREITVAVASPRGGDYAATVTLNNESVATSGDYERYYIYDGVRYHHILAPDGYPSGINEDNPVISATVIGESAMVCDALSTTLMIVGADKAGKLLTAIGYSALIIYKDGYLIIGDKDFEMLI